MKLDSPKSSEITPRELYLDRRRFLAAAAGFGAVALSAGTLSELLSPSLHAMAGSRLAALTIGPDGAIYISNFGAAPPGLGQILRVEITN